MNTLK